MLSEKLLNFLKSFFTSLSDDKLYTHVKPVGFEVFGDILIRMFNHELFQKWETKMN